MIEKIDFEAEVSKAPAIVQQIIKAGKSWINEIFLHNLNIYVKTPKIRNLQVGLRVWSGGEIFSKKIKTLWGGT